MGLYVDVKIGQVVIPHLYLHIIAPSEGPLTAYYAIGIYDRRGGSKLNILPIEQCYFTFGEYPNLLPYDRNLPAREQCYNDFKNRFELGMLPWAENVTEEEDV